MARCEWSTSEEIYIKYHDEEWGVPVYDDKLLFAKLLLDGAQAGLSWITILKKRENYWKLYGFEPAKMAKWTDAKIEKLLLNPGIIRNRLKVTSARSNAQVFLEIVKEVGSFSEYIWSFVGGKPIQNKCKSMAEIRATSPESDAMAKDLKKRGFKFCGSTICYAFMQAVGMVNDHMTSCFRYKEIKKLTAKAQSTQSRKNN